MKTARTLPASTRTTNQQLPDVDAMWRDIATMLARMDDPCVIRRVWKILLREVMR